MRTPLKSSPHRIPTPVRASAWTSGSRTAGLPRRVLLFACLALSAASASAQSRVVFDQVSAYHHIQVLDERGMRRLSFNGSWETRMSLLNPLSGHFEYTEYFQAPWLWNHDVRRVLVAGLGGGSTQRALAHYATNTIVDTVELDPTVVTVAKTYFGVVENASHLIHTNDARVFLRRTTNTYDVILMDAYGTTRYGSSIPPHLVTKEFFLLASSRMTTNGVLAYNVIGQIDGWRANVVGAIYRTLNDIFPQIYLFPAKSSQNVVIIATKSKERFDKQRLQQEAQALIRSKSIRFPALETRIDSFVDRPPSNATASPLLTDDYAPIEGLLQGR